MPPTVKAPIKKAPRHLDAEHQKIWREIVSNAPEGLLGSCDAVVVESAARLTYKMRNNYASFSSTDNGQLLNAMGKLGGTPGDRQRLNVTLPPEKTDKESAWDDL